MDNLAWLTNSKEGDIAFVLLMVLVFVLILFTSPHDDDKGPKGPGDGWR